MALAFYEAGVDGLTFWDTYQRYDATSQWPTLRRLGNVEELRSWADQGKDDVSNQIRLVRLAGHTMDRYSPYGGA